MSHAIEFIETAMFTKAIQAIASEEELQQLQNELIAQPDKGELIQGTGGLRKVRMATGTQGKGGGAQAAFAQAIGTSLDTVKSWESKRRNPTGLAAKVLATLQQRPGFYEVLAAH